MKPLVALLVGCALRSLTADNGEAKEECFRSSISKPSPFLGNGGEIIVLADGSVWKDLSYKYLYLYAYTPSVVVCPAEGKMMLGDHVFSIMRVARDR